MFTLSFEVTGGKEIEQALVQAQRALQANIRTFIKDAGNLTRDNVREGVPVFMGTARKSIYSDPSFGGTVSTATIGTVDDITKMQTIESGRRPGAKRPPRDVLLAWVRKHNFAPDLDDDHAAFVLARAIGKRGSHTATNPTGHRMFEMGFEKSKGPVFDMAMKIEKVF